MLHLLVGEDGGAGGDASQYWNLDGSRESVQNVGRVGLIGGQFNVGGGLLALRQDHFQGARPVGVTPQKALRFQRLELVRDAGGTGQAHCVAHLADRGRVAAGLDGLLDELENAPLSRGQAGRVVLAGYLGYAHGARDRLVGRTACSALLRALIRTPGGDHGSTLELAAAQIKHLFEHVAPRVVRRERGIAGTVRGPWLDPVAGTLKSNA